MSEHSIHASLLQRVVAQTRGTRLVAALTRALRGRRRLAAVRWYGTDDPQQAARSLVQAAAKRASAGDWFLILGDGTQLQQRVNAQLTARGIAHRSMSTESARELAVGECAQLAGVICGYEDARRTQEAADALRQHPALSTVPFDYVVGLEPERAVFERLDEYANARFASPTMVDTVPVYDIYEDSLRRFEQKCGLRDYLDLYQCLKSIVERGIDGDIAEFGSYKGHSGYLIARTLQAMEAPRRLFLFDTFDHFPEEPLGLDHFWSGTHRVDFAEVQARFADFEQVYFERGDFTQTLATSDIDRIALAYIDCDAYRSVRYLAEQLWHERIVDGGMMVFEDYGHPALLGARSAVHEFFDGRRDCVRWYSHFSGLYIAVKAAPQ